MGDYDRQPRADERTEPIITSFVPKVQHKPRHPGIRHMSLMTMCGKHGWFWTPGSTLAKEMPAHLANCKECERRG